MRTSQLRSGWRKRVNPAFVRWWLAIKANRAWVRIPDEKKRNAAWSLRFKELCVASCLLNEARKQLKDPEFQQWEIDKPLDGEVWPWPVRGEPEKAYITNPESCPFFRTLVFLKHGLTFREMVCELERDPKAYDKWMKVHADYRRFRWGTPVDKLKMKFRYTHFQIISQGLDFGLKGLTEQELAECLDEICPFCSKEHSSDYLSKLRSRIIKACQSLGERNARSTTLSPPP